MESKKHLGQVVLEFDEGFDYSELVGDLKPKSKKNHNGKVFLNLFVGKNGEFNLPVELTEYVRLVITPEDPTYSTIDGKKMMVLELFATSDGLPLPIVEAKDDGLQDYILIKPDTDFIKLEITAQRERKTIIEYQKIYFGTDDDGLFELELPQSLYGLKNPPPVLLEKVHNLFLKR